MPENSDKTPIEEVHLASGDMSIESEEEIGIETIEAGAITDLNQDGVDWEARRHHAETASKLATWIFGLLAVSALIHYFVIAIFSFYEKENVVESLSSIYGIWLPVISGFFGAAVTYYFTRDR